MKKRNQSSTGTIKSPTHEDLVESFYSSGSETRATEADGFLSFGLWDASTRDYFQSSLNLIDFFLKECDIAKPDAILNVACGYGAESIRFFRHLRPREMHCIDITSAHITHARRRTMRENIVSGIFFEKKDACRTGFKDSQFSHIIGIEGPAHFNTREDFFRECHRLLKRKGGLIITDITLNWHNATTSFLLKKLTVLIARLWHMPEANWMSPERYRENLEENGFRIDKFQQMGRDVFPRFASYNTSIKSIVNAINTRGVTNGIGLSLISWFLGYGYRKGIIDYIFVRATRL